MPQDGWVVVAEVVGLNLLWRWQAQLLELGAAALQELLDVNQRVHLLLELWPRMATVGLVQQVSFEVLPEHQCTQRIGGNDNAKVATQHGREHLVVYNLLHV